MGKQLYELRDMLMDELDKLTAKGELTAGSLETVDKLTHSIKSIDTICAMEEAGGYSNEGGMSYEGGNSYARGRGGNARRDSRGRYSSEGGMSYARRSGGYSRRGGYSGDGKEELVESLRELMQEADDSRSRQAIQQAIQQLEG